MVMTMANVLLNGREPLDWELAALERGRRCERERDTRPLAGVLSTDPRRDPGRPPKPVADVMWEFGS